MQEGCRKMQERGKENAGRMQEGTIRSRRIRTKPKENIA